MKSRLIGQDVQIRISTRQTGRLASVTAVKNFVFNINMTILTEKLLGEKNDRKDVVFDSVSGSFMVQPEDPELFVFQQAQAQRAIDRKQVEDIVVLSWSYLFANQRRATFTVPDPQFGTMTQNAGQRDNYVETPFTWEAESYELTV
jgi:hypothetical protein